MSAPMNYTDLAKELLTQMGDIKRKLDSMDKKIDDLFEEDDVSDIIVDSGVHFDDFVSEDAIYTKGRRVPYNRIIDSKEIDEFRSFITYIRLNERQFTQKEVDYAGFAEEKSEFPDVRLSDNSRRILGAAYIKIYKKPWGFNFQRGNMHKYMNQIAWSWSDGTRD